LPPFGGFAVAETGLGVTVCTSAGISTDSVRWAVARRAVVVREAVFLAAGIGTPW
jgi:hypothetical protein